MSYSKRVHCSECGNIFPLSETELLAVGKTVLRLCRKDYERKRPATEAEQITKAQLVEELKSKKKER